MICQLCFIRVCFQFHCGVLLNRFITLYYSWSQQQWNSGACSGLSKSKIWAIIMFEGVKALNQNKKWNVADMSYMFQSVAFVLNLRYYWKSLHCFSRSHNSRTNHHRAPTSRVSNTKNPTSGVPRTTNPTYTTRVPNPKTVSLLGWKQATDFADGEQFKPHTLHKLTF